MPKKTTASALRPPPPAPDEKPHAPFTPRCLECDYNLMGVCDAESPNGECPECGEAFDYGWQRHINTGIVSIRLPLQVLCCAPPLTAVMLGVTSFAGPLASFLGFLVVSIGFVSVLVCAVDVSKELARRWTGRKIGQTLNSLGLLVSAMLCLLIFIAQLVVVSGLIVLTEIILR